MRYNFLAARRLRPPAINVTSIDRREILGRQRERGLLSEHEHRHELERLEREEEERDENNAPGAP